MKIINPIFPLCTAVLLTSVAAVAGDSTATGVMQTPEQIMWKDNPRVRGLGVARILGSAKKPGAFVHRVKFPAGRVVQVTGIGPTAVHYVNPDHAPKKK